MFAILESEARTAKSIISFKSEEAARSYLEKYALDLLNDGHLITRTKNRINYSNTTLELFKCQEK